MTYNIGSQQIVLHFLLDSYRNSPKCFFFPELIYVYEHKHFTFNKEIIIIITANQLLFIEYLLCTRQYV